MEGLKNLRRKSVVVQKNRRKKRVYTFSVNP